MPDLITVNTVSQSGKALARLVLAPEMEHVTGKYFEGKQEIASSKASYDVAKAKDLWDTSLELVDLSETETILTLDS